MQLSWLIVGLGILSTPSGANTADFPITFRSRAARLERIFPELSKAAGVSLLFSPQTKDEVLVIQVDQVPLKTLMEKIAKATAAEWIQERDAFRLIRTPSHLAELKRKHDQRTAVRFTEYQEILGKNLKSAGEINEARAVLAAEQLKNAYARTEGKARIDESDYLYSLGLKSVLPGWRLAAQLALLIPAKALAESRLGETIVFSTTPNRLQRALPKGAIELIDEYKVSAQRLVSNLPKNMPVHPAGLEQNVATAINLTRVGDLTPDRVHFRFTRLWSGSSANAEVIVANSTGRIIDRSTLAFNTRELNDGPPKIELSIHEDEPIDLTPLSKSWLKVLSRLAEYRSPESPREFQPLLTHPEAHELTENLYSDLLFGLGKAAHLNVVAVPSKSGAFANYGAAPLTPLPSRFFRTLQSNFPHLTLSVSDSFLLVEPTDWFEESRFTVERSALERFFRKAVKPLSFNDIADLAASSASGEAYHTQLRILQLLAPDAIDPRSGAHFEVLRLYGTFTSLQRAAALSNDGLQWDRLTPLQKENLQTLMLGNDKMSMSIVPQIKVDANSGFVWPHESIFGQPTEVYAEAIPQGSRIRIESNSKHLIRAFIQKSKAYKDFDIPSFARMLHSRENREKGDPDSIPSFGSYQTFEQLRLLLIVETFPYTKHVAVTSYIGPSSEEVNAISALPRDLAEELNRQLSSLRSGRTPPP